MRRHTVGKPEPVDLIHLADAAGNQCVVRVTGRHQPGVLPGHDTLCADVLLSADFLDARLALRLSQRDLTTWSQQLAALAPGDMAELGGGRGLQLVLRVNEDRSVSVTIHDPDRLSALFAIQPHDDWVQDHRDRLEHVRRVWPSEVVEAVPMVYEWSPVRGD
ncbi:DUF5959 family protein [Streptomyces sp. NPDC001890]|uniref:DUF5959 family protein n=1 Tax=Streptomyces sp. NPDC001890 TaxID=3364620 RepID=UPI0036ADD7B3